MLTISANIDGALAKLKQSSSDLIVKNRDALNQAGHGVIAAMVNRTQNGQGCDATGNAYGFSPYTAQYAKRREKAGRQTGHRDNNFSGQMLAAITITDNDGKTVHLGIPEATQWEKAYYTNILQPWFHATQAERALAMRIIRSAYGK